MSAALFYLLAVLRDGQVLQRSGRKIIGVDPGALAPAGDFEPATTDAYDLGETSTPKRWRIANLSRGVAITHGVLTSGVRTAIAFTGAADTGRTTGTAQPDVLLNGQRIVTWATGAITAQAMVEIRAQTIAFAGASVVTHAATVDIDAAPTAGTNATFTNSYALRVRAGRAHFGGAVTMGTDQTFAREVNHVISVEASTTADTAGGNLTVRAGDGGATNANGGNLVADAGAKAGSGTDGTVSVGATNAEAVTIGRTGKTTTVGGHCAVTGRFGCNGVAPPAQPPTVAAITPAGVGALDGADTVDKAVLLAAIQDLQAKVNQLSSMARGNGLVAAS